MPGDNDRVRIRIEGTDLPGSSCGPGPAAPGGHRNIHVAVQRRGKPGELLGLVPGDAPSATWTLRGPYIQGPPGGRFVYLNWGDVDPQGTFRMFRRAKLRLDAVPAEVLRAAQERGVLVARVVLTDAKGHPTCASVAPPHIAWSAAPD